MPVWKPQAAWLREAITSALGQVDCSIELVVIDDGCEPSVAELLDRIDDPRMRVLRVPHGGASLARNAGIEAARGDYIRFVDSDDVLVADSTAHLLTLTGGNDRIITYGATLVCDVGLQPMSTIETGTQGRVAEDCLLNRFATTIHSLLFPRSVVDENGPWESSLVVSEDWDYALRAFERADVRGDRRVATHYRMHSQMNSRNVPEGIRSSAAAGCSAARKPSTTCSPQCSWPPTSAATARGSVTSGARSPATRSRLSRRCRGTAPCR
jgi:glycosyltransferase involved in cell wall biosynthesis